MFRMWFVTDIIGNTYEFFNHIEYIELTQKMHCYVVYVFYVVCAV